MWPKTSQCKRLMRSLGLLAISAFVIQFGNRLWSPIAVHAQQSVTCADWAKSAGDVPPVPTVIDSTCAVIPPDFKGTPVQKALDLYSWVAFLAVNWPACQGTCAADNNLSILTSAPSQVPPVWTTYLQDSDVFVPSGQQPAAWCFAASYPKQLNASARSYRLAHLPPKVRALANKHPEVTLFLHHDAKAVDRSALLRAVAADQSSPLPEILQATGDILVDQNGRWARFTVAMNKDEYNYIVSKTLWTKAGQKNAGIVTFPVTPTGAIEFKSAWKVLGSGDDASHFFTTSAIVYNDADGAPSPGPNPVTVGLVGLHIVHKTGLQPKWIWSTFEQVENDTKSFYNSSCSVKQCPPNKPTVASPATALELDANGKPNYAPAQVVAVTPASAQHLNSAFQKMLAGTPWAYYQLISTQWVGELGSGPKPPQLGNSVQETFLPAGPMYSCMKCHSYATLKGSPKVSADFSYMLMFAPQQ